MPGLIRWLVLTGLMVLGMQKPVAAEGELQVALKRALQEYKITGGTALHIGASTPTLAEGLYKQGHFLVQIVVGSNETRDNIRAELIEKGLQGPVSAYRLRGNKLPHNSNLAALLVVEDTLEFDEAELDRVLAPGGVLLRRADGGWSTHVKAFPPSMDDWRHIDHDGGRSRTARDVTVGHPSGLRWIASSDMWGKEKSEQTTSLMLAAEGKLVTVRPAQDRKTLWVSAYCAWSGILLWHKQLDPPAQGRGETFRGRCTGLVHGSGIWARNRVMDLHTGADRFAFKGLPRMAWKDTVVCVDLDDAKQAAPLLREPSDGSPVKINRVIARDATTGKERWSCEAINAAGVADVVYVLGKQDQNWVLEARAVGKGAQRWRTVMALADEPALPEKATLHLLCSKRYVVALSRNHVYWRTGKFPKTAWVYSAKDGKFLRTVSFMPPLRAKSWVLRDVCLDADDVLWFWTDVDAEVSLYSGNADRQAFRPDAAEPFPQKKMRLVGYSLTTGKVVRSYVLGEGRTLVRCAPWFMSGRHAVFGDNQYINVEDGTAGRMQAFRLACALGYMSAYRGLYVPPSANCGCINRLHGLMAYDMEGPGVPRPADAGRDCLEKGAAYGSASPTSPAAIKLKRDPKLSELVLKTIRRGAAHSPTGTGLEDGTVRTHKERMASDRPEWMLAKTPLVVPWVADDSRVVAVLPGEHRIAMLRKSGEELVWAFTADARLNPGQRPHLIGDLCVFGARDGWVYAVRATDGTLVWRNLAAPEDKRVVAYEQLESPWPVHLQMVVRDGRVYAACGMHFDTGVTVSCVELATGKALWKRCVSDPDDEKEQQLRAFRADGMRLDEATGSVATGFWLLDPVTGEVTTLLEKAGAKPNTKEWWKLFIKTLNPIKQRGYRE